MGLSAGAALGRWIRQYPNGQLYSYIIAGLILVGFILYIVWNEQRAKKIASAGRFRLITLHSDIDTAHLLHESVPDPDGIRSRLRAFNTPDEAYAYLYEKFNEPIYKNLLLHLPGAEPFVFSWDAGKSREENLSQLTADLSNDSATGG